MSGFSADWLALREPADHRARSRDLLDALAAPFRDRDEITVLDLGCGTGSNLRACAPHLPRRQSWRLVDHDPGLLGAARRRLSAWADAAEAVGGGLRLTRGDAIIEAAFVKADLAGALDPVLDPPPDLVTAAALLDLVSPAWIERFAQAVAQRGAAFYTALTYNGAEAWEPPHPADAAMLRAFHAHQARDKGFGPSAGPEATALLTAAFAAHGYGIRLDDSPWRLESADAALIAELAKGAATAVRDTGLVEEHTIAAWLEARLAGASCTIGHTDFLALPLG